MNSMQLIQGASCVILTYEANNIFVCSCESSSSHNYLYLLYRTSVKRCINLVLVYQWISHIFFSIAFDFILSRQQQNVDAVNSTKTNEPMPTTLLQCRGVRFADLNTVLTF